MTVSYVWVRTTCSLCSASKQSHEIRLFCVVRCSILFWGASRKAERGQWGNGIAHGRGGRLSQTETKKAESRENIGQRWKIVDSLTISMSFDWSKFHGNSFGRISVREAFSSRICVSNKNIPIWIYFEFNYFPFVENELPFSIVVKKAAIDHIETVFCANLQCGAVTTITDEITRQ